MSRRKPHMAAARFSAAVFFLTALCRAQTEPIREWLIWGPYPGMAGLSASAPEFEARIRPATGDLTPAVGVGGHTVRKWQRHAAPETRIDLDLPETFAERPGVMGWSGGCAYAHVYLRAPVDTEVILDLRAGWRLTAWLNGERVTREATLRRGWNPLLIKVFFAPQHMKHIRGWWFQCDVASPDGAVVPGLEAGLDDPERDPAELAHPEDGLGARTDVRLAAPNRWQPLFDIGEEVAFDIAVSQAKPGAGEATRRIEGTVLDSQSRVVTEVRQRITYSHESPARVRVEPRQLPVGHYRIAGCLRGDAGVTAYLPPLSFVVLRGPVDCGRDEAPRKLAGCDYWLMNSGTHRERIRWLAQVGLTRNVGSFATWWTSYRDGKVGTDYRGFVDETLDEAERVGVDVVGYVEGGWPVQALQAQPREHWLKQGLKPERLVIWPWHPLPEFGSAAYADAVRRYVTQTVRRYRDRIRTWKSYNEVDIAGKMPPEQYAKVAQILYEAVKAADPRSRMIGASFVRMDSEWCKGALNGTDAPRWHDVYDVHAHPQGAPTIGGSIGNSPNEGLSGIAARIADGAPDKPIWYGEVSPPLAHAEGGQWEQAGHVVKQAAFAAAEERVEVLAWLVPYGGAVPWIATSGPRHLPFPAVVAISLCAHLLDGRRLLPSLPLPAGVQHVRVTHRDGGETVVLWNARPLDVTVRTAGRDVRTIDPVGQERIVAAADGRVTLRIGPTPLFVVGKGFRGAE